MLGELESSDPGIRAVRNCKVGLKEKEGTKDKTAD